MSILLASAATAADENILPQINNSGFQLLHDERDDVRDKKWRPMSLEEKIRYVEEAKHLLYQLSYYGFFAFWAAFYAIMRGGDFGGGIVF